jgi:hypothetical protein
MSVLVDPERTKEQRSSAARTIVLSVGLLSLAIIAPRMFAAYGNIFFAGFVVFVGLGLWERRGTFVQQKSLIHEEFKPHVMKSRQKNRRNRARAN